MLASLPRFLLILMLGFAAAGLVACGGSSKGLLAGTSADELKSQLDTISGEVQNGQCSQAKADAHDLGAKVGALPASVDPKLRSALSDGAKKLLDLAAGDCKAPKSTVPTTSSTASTDTAPSTPSTTTSTPTTNSTPTTTSTPSTPTTPTNTKPAPTTPTTPNNGGAGSGPGGSGGGAGPGKGK